MSSGARYNGVPAISLRYDVSEITVEKPRSPIYIISTLFWSLYFNNFILT